MDESEAIRLPNMIKRSNLKEVMSGSETAEKEMTMSPTSYLKDGSPASP